MTQSVEISTHVLRPNVPYLQVVVSSPRLFSLLFLAPARRPPPAFVGVTAVMSLEAAFPVGAVPKHRSVQVDAERRQLRNSLKGAQDQ